jgi:hypothetical protein
VVAGEDAGVEGEDAGVEGEGEGEGECYWCSVVRISGNAASRDEFVVFVEVPRDGFDDTISTSSGLSRGGLWDHLAYSREC